MWTGVTGPYVRLALGLGRAELLEEAENPYYGLCRVPSCQILTISAFGVSGVDESLVCDGGA